MSREEKINLAKSKIKDACLILQEVLNEEDYELTDCVMDSVDSYLESRLEDYER
jgi:hypothetical protein